MEQKRIIDFEQISLTNGMYDDRWNHETDALIGRRVNGWKYAGEDEGHCFQVVEEKKIISKKKG